MVCFGEATVTLVFLLDFSDRQGSSGRICKMKSRNYQSFTLNIIALNYAHVLRVCVYINILPMSK
jgi:hypothetical protein